MLCGLPATNRVDVVRDASPEPSSVPVPIVVVPSLKVTVPLGVPSPIPLELTVAVNVSESPYVLGFVPDVRARLVEVDRRAKKSLSPDVPPATSTMLPMDVAVPVFAYPV